MPARWTILLASVAACGRYEFGARDDASTVASDDAPLDGGPPCTLGPWGAPVRVPELSTAGVDWGPALSPSGLVLVFDSTAAGSRDLYVATRATASGTFGTATPIASVNSSNIESDPAWSSDGTQLYYSSYDLTTMTGSARVVSYLGGGAFGTPVDTTPPTGLAWSYSEDGLEVFSTNNPTGSNDDLAHLIRQGASWTTVDDLGALNTPASEGWPSFDARRQTLYFERDNGTNIEIAVATRAGAGLPFGPATTLSLGEAGADDGDPEISRDGTTLLFSSLRTGSAQNDIYLVMRACQ